MAAVAKGEQRRALVIAGAGFVLVLALFVGSRLLAGGGGDEVADPTLPPTPAPETTPGTPPGPGAAGDGVIVPVVPIPELPDAFELAEIRDPFTPPLAIIDFLRSLQPAPGEPGQPGEPGEPGEPGAPGQPGIGPEDVTFRDVAVDPETGEPFATIDVAGELFEAGEGERFGPGGEFMVVTLDPEADCATFLFGDEAFSACVGQETPTPGGQPVPQK